MNVHGCTRMHTDLESGHPSALDTNPLRVGLPRERVPEPCLVVILGGAGDLARRKLLPALYHLHLNGLLPKGFAIICYASQEMDDEAYRGWAHDAIAKAAPHAPSEGPSWEGFAELLHYCRRTDEMVPSLTNLKSRIDEASRSICSPGNCLFYLAIPPSVIGPTADGLREAGLADQANGWKRLVVEKPFGEDLASARELGTRLHQSFPEDRIYRIDHYLGKDTVQNILIFRFANEFIEPILNREHVDHIQITVAETLGMEGRGAFYDSTGALRDLLQNHMLQLMALTCMDQPQSLEPEAVRDARAKLLASVAPIEARRVDEVALRGQYTGGMLLGASVRGYREEKDVAPDSITETFVCLKLAIDNPRWRGVPIYLRTGKRLAKHVTEIAIQLACPGTGLFRCDVPPNVLALNVQPDEGVSMRFDAKVPGIETRIRPVRMDFRYASGFGTSVPEAYERLLLDAMLGDSSLYARADAVEASWAICDPILQAWKQTGSPIYPYSPGTWGPREADDLIATDGRKWRRL